MVLGSDPLWADAVRQWAEEQRNRPRLCGRCGGLGKRRGVIRRAWRECRACHGSGGAVDDERAWWEAGR